MFWWALAGVVVFLAIFAWVLRQSEHRAEEDARFARRPFDDSDNF